MKRSTSFLVALLVVAASLRSPITAVGPLLQTIRGHFDLSATAAGLLSSLPLIMFGAFAPASRLARSHGMERVVLAMLLATIAGTLLRSEGHVSALFTGTFLLAGGIAVTNILMPMLVKEYFPDRIPTITTAYASVMGGFAALGSGLSAPLARVLPGDWRASLASWAVIALIAVLLWLPHLATPHTARTADVDPPRIPWGSTLAWQVTGFMGFQSTVFYVTVNWYPTMLREAGVPIETTGWLLTWYQVAAIVAGLAVPALIRRLRDQRALAAAAGVVSGVGTLGVLLAPQAALGWMLVLGIGSGPALILALSFMGLRAAGPRAAASLSLMAQSVGYLMAALGPVVFGLVHDLTGGWTWPMLLVVGCTLGMIACGVGAGRALREGDSGFR